MGALGRGVYLQRTKDVMPRGAQGRLRLFPAGSVLFTKSGMSLLLNQRAIISSPMHVVSHIGVAIPTPPLAAEWIYYWLTRVDFADLSHATTLPSLQLSKVRELRVPIPPLQEQRRIVEAIESYLTRLDNAVALLERVEQNLKRYRASVLKAAVEGRLVPTEAELARRERRPYEPASELLKRILAERKTRWIEDAAERARATAEERARKASQPWTAADDAATVKKERAKAANQYAQPAAPNTTDLPELPEGWCWATTLECCEDVFLGLTSRVDYVDEGGVPLVRASDIRNGRLDMAGASRISKSQHDFLTRYRRPSRGDVLVSKSGSLGTCATVDTDQAFSIYESIIALRPSDCVSQRYLLWALRSMDVQRRMLGQQVGSTVGHLNLKAFRTLPIPLPPPSEQARIAAQVDRAFSLIEAASQSLASRIGYATRLRSSILKWAFEGKLVEQDPNDEPASVLLERIRAERAAAGAPKARAGKRRSAE